MFLFFYILKAVLTLIPITVLRSHKEVSLESERGNEEQVGKGGRRKESEGGREEKERGKEEGEKGSTKKEKEKGNAKKKREKKARKRGGKEKKTRIWRKKESKRASGF
uniref:Pxr1 n=1 Tax=Strongyloides stercoralis TaxID=6248 RepID=A0A0K0DZU5_STRER